MTRRSNLVRSEANAGEARNRAFVGGCQIYCADGKHPSLAIADGISFDITSISLKVRMPYQRIYAAATISSIEAVDSEDDPAMVDIYLVAVNDTSGYENTIAHTSGGNFYSTLSPGATITGVTDLDVGANRITLRMVPADIDGSANFGGAGLQVILGQIVDTPGCGGEGGSG